MHVALLSNVDVHQVYQANAFSLWIHYAIGFIYLSWDHMQLSTAAGRQAVGFFCNLIQDLRPSMHGSPIFMLVFLCVALKMLSRIVCTLLMMIRGKEAKKAVSTRLMKSCLIKVQILLSQNLFSGGSCFVFVHWNLIQ
jgi:hypothetical protein